MHSNQKTAIASLCLLAALAPAHNLAANTEQGADDFIEETLVVGRHAAVRQIAGAAYYLGPEQLARFVDSDIQSVVRAVPGVSVQIEDGYGLRPNIGIRGVGTERSSRIVLLEDNIPIAPAPYAASSAYYFPTVGRMAAIEVVKGPAAISQGPYTVGGAINLISTPITERDSEGRLLASAGANNAQRVHGTWSARRASGPGLMVETHQWRDDGFQDIDRSADHSGLRIADYGAKIGWTPRNSAHSWELKLQQAAQSSNQSYLGLTNADFAASPLRRYGLSALDNIDTDHQQLVLRHRWQIAEGSRLSLAAYNNSFSRNWYKTEGLDLDGSGATDADAIGGFTRWSAAIDAINSGDAIVIEGEDDNGGVVRTVLTATELRDILHGGDTPDDINIVLRANNREYFSRGVQMLWQYRKGAHRLEVGARYHRDEEDRLQHQDAFAQRDGALTLASGGTPGVAVGNRIQDADARSLYLQHRMRKGPWLLSWGLRHENIGQSRTRYSDPARTRVRDSRENRYAVWLPGAGLTFDMNPRLSLVAGVHRGFSAAGNSEGADPEEAINYEAGLRWRGDSYSLEAMAFLSDYDNILGDCTASSGADCAVGDSFNGDAATVQGLELDMRAAWQWLGYGIPLHLGYTWTDAHFDNGIADSIFFGEVSPGDPLPYIPRHQGQIGLGLESARWSWDARLRLVDAVCTRASCERDQRTGSLAILDLALHYNMAPGTRLMAKLENASGDIDLVSRHPYGARPGKDRSLSLALQLDF